VVKMCCWAVGWAYPMPFDEQCHLRPFVSFRSSLYDNLVQPRSIQRDTTRHQMGRFTIHLFQSVAHSHHPDAQHDEENRY